MAFNDQFDYKSPPVAQPTIYNGTEYRSKLEAKTAQALDIIGIPYKYERKGYKISNGMWYKPDFWLIESHQYIECKGEMKTTDSAKIVGLVEEFGYPVLVLNYSNAMLVKHYWNDYDGEVVWYCGDEIQLVRCSNCGCMWFISTEDNYECPSCGAGNGDSHISEMVQIESAYKLFKHSQEVASDKPKYREIVDAFNR